MPDKGFDVGQMRHRVSVRLADTGPLNLDPSGQDRPTPGEWVTYWAKVEPLQGRELVAAKQVKAEVTHRVVMRVNGPLDSEATLIFPGFEPGDDRGDLTGRRKLGIVSILREGEVDGYYILLTSSTP